MASHNNPFVSSVLSRRCYTKRTNVILEGWPWNRRDMVHLFVLWAFFGAIVLAKPSTLQAKGDTDLKADLRLEHKGSSHNLLNDDFDVQLEDGIGAAIAADSETKSTHTGKGSRDVNVLEGEFELEQDKLDSADGLKSMFGTNSEGSRNDKARRHQIDDGRPADAELDASNTDVLKAEGDNVRKGFQDSGHDEASERDINNGSDDDELDVLDTSDLNAEGENERKRFRNLVLGDDLSKPAFENLVKERPSYRIPESGIGMGISRTQEAVEDALQSRVQSSGQEGKKTLRGTRKHKSFNDGKTKRDSGGPDGESSVSATAALMGERHNARKGSQKSRLREDRLESALESLEAVRTSDRNAKFETEMDIFSDPEAVEDELRSRVTKLDQEDEEPKSETFGDPEAVEDALRSRVTKLDQEDEEPKSETSSDPEAVEDALRSRVTKLDQEDTEPKSATSKRQEMDIFSNPENLEDALESLVTKLDQEEEEPTSGTSQKQEMDIFRDPEAMADALQSRVTEIDQEDEEPTSGISRKQESFKSPKTQRERGGAYHSGKREDIASPDDRRSRDEGFDQSQQEKLAQINQGSTSTRRTALKRGRGSHAKRRSKKSDPKLNSATADDRHHDASITEVKPSISTPEFSADVLPSSDPDDLSQKRKPEHVSEPPEDTEPEETDENEHDRNLIPEYSLGEPVTEWDSEREQWLEDHPEVKPYTDDGRVRLFILTGTQPRPCSREGADHLYLRFFKNKVDYCRIHGIDIFYNMGLLHPEMPSFWAKLPLVRATMLSHPEAEWIWWLDADAIITDMEFEIPLEKYEDYNMVVHGWESLVYEKKSWVSLNAGSFLMRNCQWSIDFLERWASIGPQAPLGEAYRYILSDDLSDRPTDPTDDQSALVYLLNAEKERWAGKVKVELEYFLNGYFVELIDGFEEWEQRYRAVEEEEEELIEMVAMGEVGKEKMVKKLGRAREKRVGKWRLRERRPFVTHFTGCQPCTGNKNPVYSTAQCFDGMVRALNFADDQVLRSLGVRHSALHSRDLVSSSSSA